MHHWKENRQSKFKTDNQPKIREKVMWWNISDLVTSKPSLRNFLLFAHIWGGCDTTSATHQQGVHGLTYFDLLKMFDKPLASSVVFVFSLKFNQVGDVLLYPCESH